MPARSKPLNHRPRLERFVVVRLTDEDYRRLANLAAKSAPLGSPTTIAGLARAIIVHHLQYSANLWPGRPHLRRRRLLSTVTPPEVSSSAEPAP